MDPMAAKYIGAGIACIGMGGAGVGVGTIFGNYLAAALRNPSAAQGQFANLIFGFAVTEALAIFSLLIALPGGGWIIADRRKRISDDLDEAARMKDAADAAIASYEKGLADARARAQAIAAQTRDQISAEAEARRKAVEASLHAKLTAAEQ